MILLRSINDGEAFRLGIDLDLERELLDDLESVLDQEGDLDLDDELRDQLE